MATLHRCLKSPERLKVEGVSAMPYGCRKSLPIDLLLCKGVVAQNCVHRRTFQNRGLQGCHDGKNNQHEEFHFCY